MIRIVNVSRLSTNQRKHVCYCGRECYGFPRSPWANPFRVHPISPKIIDPAERERLHKQAVDDCLKKFVRHFEHLSRCSDVLADLWEACEHGKKPLGCWCVDAVVGDGQPVVCHAQILGEMLVERFGDGKAEDGVGERASL